MIVDINEGAQVTVRPSTAIANGQRRWRDYMLMKGKTISGLMGRGSVPQRCRACAVHRRKPPATAHLWACDGTRGRAPSTSAPVRWPPTSSTTPTRWRSGGPAYAPITRRSRSTTSSSCAPTASRSRRCTSSGSKVARHPNLWSPRAEVGRGAK